MRNLLCATTFVANFIYFANKNAISAFNYYNFYTVADALVCRARNLLH